MSKWSSQDRYVDEDGKHYADCHTPEQAARIVKLLNEGEAREWQPIEKAPKDGTRILVGCIAGMGMGPDGPVPCEATSHIAYWNPEGSSWVDECGSFDGDADHLEDTGNWSSGSGWFQPNELTHWMPLPNPPASESEPADRLCVTCGAVLIQACECPHCGTAIRDQESEPAPDAPKPKFKYRAKRDPKTGSVTFLIDES